MIVFDLDDTLYLERDFAFSGYAALDAYVLERTGRAGFGTCCRRAFAEGRRKDVFDAALDKLGLPGDADMIANLVARYRGHVPDIALCDDALRCLDRLQGAVRLGLITDGPEMTQRAKISALRIDCRFDILRPTGAWAHGFSKPHPRAFIEMEAASDGAPLVYVADNPLKDFVTPRARGWMTIQICRADRIHTAPPPDAAHAAHVSIVSLDQLEDAVALLGRALPARA